MSTIIALAVADSRVAAHQEQAAQRDKHDGGEVEKATLLRRRGQNVRQRKPNRSENSELRYCDHPTATAAVEMPYSRIKHAATPKATISPSVA